MLANKQNSQESNSSNSQSKPQTYRVIRLIGEGSFGKAYLVECNADRVNKKIKKIVFSSNKNNEY